MIEPSEGVVYAPFDGTVMTVFPTKHAIGLISDNGMELLIHIGVDTVQLEGKHFETFITEGQTIKKGQKIASFDIKGIEEAGYNTQVIVVTTNSQDYADLLLTDKSEVNSGDLLITGVIQN